VRERVTEIINLADQDGLDLLRSRAMEQEVLDTLDEQGVIAGKGGLSLDGIVADSMQGSNAPLTARSPNSLVLTRTHERAPEEQQGFLDCGWRSGVTARLADGLHDESDPSGLLQPDLPSRRQYYR
jgi:hypothetical protein